MNFQQQQSRFPLPQGEGLGVRARRRGFLRLSWECYFFTPRARSIAART